jgi:hypothetical protein
MSQEPDSRIRVVETAHVKPSGLYFTLSHRWGDQSFLTLTSDVSKDLQKGFTTAILPKTFRDAIEVTRRFRVRYLWIDCLCIVQDSLEDFEIEAALMRQVYSHSACNLSATGALGNQDGLFMARDPLPLYPSVVQPKWLRKAPSQYVVMDTSMWFSGVTDGPLNHRAWVLQERPLSPRVLHFG